jgi:hypothetical protein
MSPSVESLADRYSRLDAPDLTAIVESPEGDYLPEAREAARAELAWRAQSGEPEELPEVPVARQSRIVAFFAICLIFAGWSLIVQGALSLVSFLADPLWDQGLWGAVMLLAGLLFTYTASAIDRGFWGRFVKVYAVFGFLTAWSPGWHIVMGRVEDGDDLMNFLRGALMIVLSLAVHFWRRGVERRMRERERSESLEVFD